MEAPMSYKAIRLIRRALSARAWAVVGFVALSIAAAPSSAPRSASGSIHWLGVPAALSSAGGLSPAVAWTGESNQLNAFFGVSVATAGDVNKDGYADVIVGSPSYTHGQ